MEAVNNFAATYLQTDATTLGIWAGAGFLLGLILIGRRPLGLIGDLLFGIIGGVGGGYLFNRTGLDLDQYVARIAPSLQNADGSMSQNAIYIGSFAEAFIGALVLLILLRIIIRR